MELADIPVIARPLHSGYAVRPLPARLWGTRLRILVADDNLAFRQLLAQSLPNWGYEPVFAQDGTEAWDILQTDDAPQLAVLDWMMPGVAGPDLCRRLRARDDDRPYTYVLLLTALSEKRSLVNALEAGADDYLVKPVDADELRARLWAGRRVLDLQTRPARGPADHPRTGHPRSPHRPQ